MPDRERYGLARYDDERAYLSAFTRAIPLSLVLWLVILLAGGWLIG